MGYMDILNTPLEFTCVRCGISEETLPTAMADRNGGAHFTYHTPEGWWSIANRYEMILFCPDEAVTIVGGEVLETGEAGGS